MGKKCQKDQPTNILSPVVCGKDDGLCRLTVAQRKEKEATAMEGKSIIKRPLGQTGLNVTCVGLGGEGILRTYGQESAAREVIETAAGEGIIYFDTAQAYAGSQSYLGSFWRKHVHLRPHIFQTSKSASRDKRQALSDLDNSLLTLGIDYLDLWQIHDVRTQRDLQLIEAPGGALEAFIEARENGKTRFIGVTGHQSPEILTEAVRNWPVDAVLLPVNPVEGVLGGFLDKTLPAALEKGLAVIAMKVLGASHYLYPESGITAELLIRYALSQKVSLAIVGCSDPSEVMTLARVGREFAPLTVSEIDAIETKFRPAAQKLAFYRR
jgi:predicted aldo/keto reductase-like oxidoreductase